jgi:hypothetical protein
MMEMNCLAALLAGREKEQPWTLPAAAAASRQYRLS